MKRLKPGQLQFESSGFNIEGKTEEVRALVTQAATILNSMGPEYARMAWLLEDTLGLVDELQIKRDDRKVELEIDYLSKPFEEEKPSDNPEVKIVRK